MGDNVRTFSVHASGVGGSRNGRQQRNTYEHLNEGTGLFPIVVAEEETNGNVYSSFHVTKYFFS